MPDPKLQAYLAQHYLSGPKADAILARSGGGEDKKRKKRKKTSDSSSTSLRVQDDEDSWKRTNEAEEDDAEAAAVVKERKGPNFRQDGWSKVTPDGPVLTEESDSSASPANPHHQEAVPKDVAHSSETSAAAGPSKPRSGLRTKEEVRAERLAKEAAMKSEEKALAARRSARSTGNGSDDDDEDAQQAAQQARLAQETVYRDETGRRIDVKSQDEAIRREAQMAQRKEAEKKHWNRGERQREEDRKRREELDKVKSEGVARYASDERMNREMREIERAEDPALAFLTKKRSKGPQLPTYKGPPPPPNRFGIAPGYRWDGVDRGNGFEKKIFEAQGSRLRREQDANAFMS